MKRNFNISEILTSVDEIVATNKNKSNNKNKINDEYKELDKTIIDMSDNPITEKIIMDAERYLKNKIVENSSDKIKQKPLALNTLISSNIDLSKRLILNEEYTEEKKIEDYDLIEEDIGEGNNLKELENNYISENKLLKSENTKQGEIIKDLNILLNNFKKKKVYSGLYNKIKLYQEDNAVLRKKILDQSDAERRLRLQLAALNE